MLTFDPDGHIYRWRNVVVPNVTAILEDAGISDWSHVPDGQKHRAAELGTAVHHATVYEDEDDLDEASLVPRVKARLAAWRAFRADYQFVAQRREHMMYSQFGFAGTVDAIGTTPRRPGALVLVDIKTGSKTRAVGPQTAAYGHLLRVQHGEDVAARWAVYLRADETYMVDPLRDSRDWPVFLHALNLYTWKREH